MLQTVILTVPMLLKEVLNFQGPLKMFRGLMIPLGSFPTAPHLLVAH